MLNITHCIILYLNGTCIIRVLFCHAPTRRRLFCCQGYFSVAQRLACREVEAAVLLYSSQESINFSLLSLDCFTGHLFPIESNRLWAQSRSGVKYKSLCCEVNKTICVTVSASQRATSANT